MTCYNPDNRHDRVETERFKRFSYDELKQRDNLSLDISWLRDESVEDAADLPAPEVLLEEIMDDLYGVLEQLEEISEDLSEEASARDTL